MENQDIFNQFKKAADNAESPDFASMEKVWNRVEEKLDKKELKQETVLWKKWAVAASILLGISIGYQFLKGDQPTINTNDIIVQKDSIQKTTTPTNNAVVSAETVNPAIKEEAEQILEKQMISQTDLAVIEPPKTEEISSNDTVSKRVKSFSNVASVSNYGYVKSNKFEAAAEKSKDMELFIAKENKVSNAKKEKPLLVFDDKVNNKQSVKEVEMEEIESIVELPDPLYIINGVEYTEQELFGPNPTSPYTPLNEQEIDSISILQKEKATSIYGEKGKKGVVIISTKNGKPAAKKHK
ncbi:hypothetical protein IVB69_13615 [Flavobacterium sp. J49]|uniref:hypothetical protein n=1 Tax=Flavobacterium sp. J49 TaxID=2718534 RepID=UPI001594B70F|nr:hypothetical protein [Flavobacterium sp. J49]MBF6642524.1 hypothetical protein [Flavobacterium sp. J49]NIC03770.1 hypothetical protein [Flavobacterium sp. J49]